MAWQAGTYRCALFLTLTLAVLTAIAAGQQTATTSPAKPPEVESLSAQPETPANASPGPGDLLEISVYGVPDLTQRVRVNADGDVNLPLVNYVHIGGLHVEDAQSKIEQTLRAGNYVKNPHVTLLVTEYGSGAELLGEVGHPGIYPVLGQRRLYDLFSAAGGTSATAGGTVSFAHKNAVAIRSAVSNALEIARAVHGDENLHH